MRNVFVLFLVCFLMIGTQNSYAFKMSSTNPTTDYVSLFGEQSADELLELTPKKIREQTGKRLTLKEKIALKIAKRQAKKAQKSDNPKSQWVALLLCWFVGVIGIHRFYLGYTTIGILQILTLGGLGIWTLIDLIMIITGSLKPKDGSDYDPSF